MQHTASSLVLYAPYRTTQYREKTAKSNAVVLEMIGDLPDADMKPPENVLFVCKLNPVTTDNDLEIIFTRWVRGTVQYFKSYRFGSSIKFTWIQCIKCGIFA